MRLERRRVAIRAWRVRATRHERIVEEWCVEYVYCPDTWPVAPEAIEQLRQCMWLDEIASEGNAVLFQVLGDQVLLASSG